MTCNSMTVMSQVTCIPLDTWLQRRAFHAINCKTLLLSWFTTSSQETELVYSSNHGACGHDNKDAVMWLTLCVFLSRGGGMSRTRLIAWSGGSLKNGGSPSTISISIIPIDHTSTWHPPYSISTQSILTATVHGDRCRHTQYCYICNIGHWSCTRLVRNSMHKTCHDDCFSKLVRSRSKRVHIPVPLNILQIFTGKQSQCTGADYWILPEKDTNLKVTWERKKEYKNHYLKLLNSVYETKPNENKV